MEKANVLEKKKKKKNYKYENEVSSEDPCFVGVKRKSRIGSRFAAGLFQVFYLQVP